MLIVGFVIYAIAGGGSSGNDEGDAIIACQNAVTAQLAYPNDAHFPFLDAPTATHDGSRWHVSGIVSAKNGFGLSHNVNYRCTLDDDDNVLTSHVG